MMPKPEKGCGRLVNDYVNPEHPWGPDLCVARRRSLRQPLTLIQVMKGGYFKAVLLKMPGHIVG